MQECTKHFKVAKEILESHLGRSIKIEKIIKNYPDYDEADQDAAKKLTEEVDKCLITHIYLENLDLVKCRLVLKGLNSQKSLKMISSLRLWQMITMY